ncbi:hypothetical protein BSK64_06165 [Paenibacillus odorifer]|uniref:fibronectin type III domain-containing protein n=1 Tax=Paenibacillus odorifer TaxID=189426 RepID=UPI00096E2911|nr:fibronectin type III domain-containing protein [Paenibacillus odorifer]OME07840.1 hypothetical protein BSK64_06165 [Paenibacillus odorifer]
MKKLLSLLLILFFVITTIPMNTASAYDGGLLNGKIMNRGNGLDITQATQTLITDNNESTSIGLNASAIPMVWYKFDSPVSVSSYKVKSTAGIALTLYDANKKVLYTTSPDYPGNIGTAYSVTPTDAVTYVSFNTLLTEPTKTNTVYEVDIFSTDIAPKPPEAPLNLEANGGNAQVLLNWKTTSEANSYNIKRSLTLGGPYTMIVSNVTKTTYTDTAVNNGITYYYIVTAIGANGESKNSNEASATPIAPIESGRAILTVKLITDLEKEFDLSMEEINSFLEWYDARDAGTGPSKFAINKDNNNKGPFSKRTEFVIFDKILTFCVDEYSAE